MGIRSRSTWLGLIAALTLPATASAATPTLKLSVAVGPPTTMTHAIGSGYPASDGVTVTFDSTTVGSTTTSSTGTFNVAFHVPATATPGPHTVAAFDPAGVGTSATFLVRTNWALAHFDASGGGFNPYENVLGPSNAGGLSELSQLSFAGPVRSEPIYAGGQLYAGAGDAVQDLDSNSHRVMWTFTTGGAVIGSPAYPPNPCNVVVAESQDGNVYGLKALRGTELWSFSAGAPLSGSPVALVPAIQKNNEIIAAADDGSVYALNACTGALLWSNVASVTPTAPVTPAILSGVVITDGTTHTIIVVCAGDTVEALDAGTGERLWTETTGASIDAGPAVWGSGRSARVVFGDGSAVTAVNGGTGERLWTETTGGNVSGISLYSTTSVGLSGGLKISLRAIIVGDGAGHLSSLAPGQGTVNWGDTLGGAIDGPPAIANGVIYLTTASGGPNTPAAFVAVAGGDGGGILNADELNPQPYPPGPPSIGDGKVFVGDFDSPAAIFGLAG